MKLNFNPSLTLTFKEAEDFVFGKFPFIVNNVEMTPYITLTASVEKDNLMLWGATRELHDISKSPQFFTHEDGFLGYVTDEMGIEFITIYVKNDFKVSEETPLTEEIIMEFGLNNHTFNSDPADMQTDFTLPSGLVLSGHNFLGGSPVEMDELSGCNGEINITTKEQLEELIGMSFEEIEEKYNIEL